MTVLDAQQKHMVYGPDLDMKHIGYGDYSAYEIDYITVEQEKKLKNMYAKLDGCGTQEVELYDIDKKVLVNAKVFCNNRSCESKDCQNHRLYLYLRKYQDQIRFLNSDMRKPKAWIVTGWVVPYKELDRKFIRKKMLFLFKLLKNKKFGSVSAFSIHMELKVYPENHKNYGSFYIHFHVVTAGIKNLRFVRQRWGRVIRYETAIKPGNLGYYVSKYASKTPWFEYEVDRQYYYLMTYKLQMHRYSVKINELKRVKYYLVSSLLREVYNAFKYGGYSMGVCQFVVDYEKKHMVVVENSKDDYEQVDLNKNFYEEEIYC